MSSIKSSFSIIRKPDSRVMNKPASLDMLHWPGLDAMWDASRRRAVNSVGRLGTFCFLQEISEQFFRHLEALLLLAFLEIANQSHIRSQLPGRILLLNELHDLLRLK